jgi:hypothetical protein
MGDSFGAMAEANATRMRRTFKIVGGWLAGIATMSHCPHRQELGADLDGPDQVAVRVTGHDAAILIRSVSDHPHMRANLTLLQLCRTPIPVAVPTRKGGKMPPPDGSVITDRAACRRHEFCLLSPEGP